MFCRNCGTQVAANTQFCSTCGLQVAATGNPVATSKPKRHKWLIVVGAAFGLFLISALIAGIESSPSSTSPDTSIKSAQAHKMNETVTVGYWSYRVSNSQWRSSIGSEYSRETPDSTFLIVNLTIRNNDNTASVLPPLKLIDPEGREYETSSKGMLLEGYFGPLKSVNPGVTSTGRVAFDVPQGKYYLVVSGGMTSQDSAKIELE